MTSQEMLQESGQSPAAGVISRGVSPSPHLHQHHQHHQQQQQQHFTDVTSGLTLDSSIAAAATTSFPSFDPNITGSLTTGADSYGYTAAGYLSGTPASQSLSPPTDQNYAHSLQVSQSFDTGLVPQFNQSPGVPMQQPSQSSQQQQAIEDNFSNLLNSSSTDYDFSAVYSNHSPSSNTAPEYDSSLLLDSQIQLHQQSHPTGQAVNPADLVTQIPSPHSSASPQISPLEQQQQQHSSPGPMSPLGSTPGAYYTPQHSRHASLDPTAAYLTGNAHTDWQAVMNNSNAFQGHRRAPSEVSEISSAAPSPYLSQHESFDGVDNNPSPLLAAQNDPSLYDNALGIENFTLSDPHHQQQRQHQHQHQGFSPAHSPYISPQLMPQQGQEMIPNVPYLTAPTPNAQYPTPPSDLYPNGPEGMGNLAQGNLSGDIGQASQMAPPSINVEFAPPSRIPSFGPSKPAANFDTLSPPPSSTRSRGRSKSDPYAHQTTRLRSSSTSSSLEPLAPNTPRSLSPFDSIGRQLQSNPSSREPSPSRSNRRLSTSSIDSRNYILGLADPLRPGASPSDSKRVQKHPATFQCTLCPKRFTRAYNLRSHLRTHTDERPFVCTVCGKAFARQHDRKRHEGLHSGEKKFVCQGELSRGGQWGCGRRFARADALGRHFRSEAGRICIKPLLDEESQERERALMNQQQHQLQPIPQPLMIPLDGSAAGNFILPAALLAQYPALQNLQWDQLAATADDPSDIGGRSSFDASSGGEFGFEDDESGISSVSGMSAGYPAQPGNFYGVHPGQMIGGSPGDPGYIDPEWKG
ncbi:putative C2H2 transcription factor Crz1 [Aspergillus clavatus NRRL 1]|uniref:C2H2 type zinc finger domain protein n=1 Tax=Aspergillus clavatus (strain ATCC 1007 / CBS 513.65 / DSM 816 / NCTC 3887 / NRRL 1 / QM 1276 / 107) TaxID=344612 RepID=A1CQX1_ASPCL|nr:C2H2 type zinc finger domain protein [Aspergillus clavatus NRRL 1]EAW08042.1 C2H2 type zinc finger domain protein [Aspergillus clavatus NRRL 1]